MQPDELKVVICDDHHAQALLMKLWLETAGMEVIGCPHTRELAILMCEEHKPDVLIMDYSMPGERIEVTELRDRVPDTPIVLWTGYDRTDLPPEDVLACTGVLVKTLDAAQAVAAIMVAAGTGEPTRWGDLPED